ncbi:MFS transporter [Actinomadura namibiensis]|uniref:MFS transporter n=1 Tax=Actinomadura kijaniata TaxID=46161 RepID=UPI0035E408E4
MATTSGDGAPPRAGRREWTGLAVLTLPTLLLALDMSVLYLALPRLSADLGADAVEQLWIMDVYGFMIAGFLVTMGSLGDRIGRRRLLLVGSAAFAAASVLAACSTGPAMLIGARAVLGIAGATLMPSTLALIGNMFADARQRGVAIAVWMSAFMGGTAVGPLVGGALLEHFWWGSAFLLGVPVMVLLMATAPFLLPEYRDPRGGRLDLASVALSLGAVLPLVYGLKEIARQGPAAGPALAAVAGLAVGALFVRRQRRLADPLLDLRLVADRSIRAGLTIMLLGAVTMVGSFLLISLYLQLVAGLSPFVAGLWTIPGAVAMVAGTTLSPLAARRLRPAYVLAAGMAVAATGLLLIAQVRDSSDVGVLVLGHVVVCFGAGPMGAICTELVLGAAPPERAGSASAMSETSAEFGIALGVAALGSLAGAVYRADLEVPGGVPGDAAAAARGGITGAAEAAGRLPGAAGAELLEAARAAFVTGLQVTVVLSAVLAAGLAVLAAVTLRHLRPTEAAPDGARRDPVPVAD